MKSCGGPPQRPCQGRAPTGLAHKMSRKARRASRPRVPLRQLKNIPKVFHFCPVYIVKASRFSVKIYSHLEQRVFWNFLAGRAKTAADGKRIVSKLTFCRGPVIARQCAHWRGNPFSRTGDGFPRKTAARWAAVFLGMTANLYSSPMFQQSIFEAASTLTPAGAGSRPPGSSPPHEPRSSPSPCSG